MTFRSDKWKDLLEEMGQGKVLEVRADVSPVTDPANLSTEAHFKVNPMVHQA